MDWTALLLTASALGGGLALIGLGRLRTRRQRPVVEALPECPVSELEPGRFRVVGRIVPIETSPSGIDGVDCVYAEKAEYRTVGTVFVPLLREVEHGAVCHPFFLEDATGRILVDPARTLIDCAAATADGGLTAERRLRAGEEVSLAASFRPTTTDADEADGPYRTNVRGFRAVADDTGPPRLSHRTAPGMLAPPPDDVSAFLGGAGAIMILMSGLLAVATLLLL